MAHPLHPDARILNYEEANTQLVDALSDLLLICGSVSSVRDLVDVAMARAGTHYDAERHGYCEAYPSRPILIVHSEGAKPEALADKHRPAFNALTQ